MIRMNPFIRIFFLFVIPLCFIALSAHYWIKSTRYIATDNAYVKAHLLSVSSDLSGRVIHVNVKQNDQIEQGKKLFKLDRKPYLILLKKAEAELNSTRYKLSALSAEFEETKAELSEVRAEVRYYERAFSRQKKLSMRGVSSRVRLDKAERELTIVRKRSRTVEQKIKRVLAKLGGSENLLPEEHPNYLKAKAQVELAKLNLERTVVDSPASGTIGKFTLQTGEFVEKGKPLIPIIQSNEKWIEANLKETQLTHIEVGQTVEVTIDAYPSQIHKGKLVSISPSTGAELSILPPQNASGNWVKVVQRIPVRIELTDAVISERLRAGMTANVRIDTNRDRSLVKLIKSAIVGEFNGQ